MAAKLSAQDKKWQAESDAGTLQSAAEIELSPTRKRAAVAELKKRKAAIDKTIRKSIGKTKRK